VIQDQQIGTLRIENESCTLINVVVEGSVLVTNDITQCGAEGCQFSMLGSEVNGRVRVSGASFAIIMDSRVFARGIQVAGVTGDVLVANNIVAGRGNLVVRDNFTEFGGVQQVVVYDNTVGGNIRCRNNNGFLEDKNFAGGTIDCTGE